MRISASLDAGRLVRERGGELYIWLKSLGPRSGYGTLKVSTERPAHEDIAFAERDAGGFRILLDAALPRPDAIEVYVRRWPRRRLAVRGFRHGYAGDGAGGEAIVVWESGGGAGGGDGGGGNGGAG